MRRVKCIVANVDADDKKNSELSKKYDISGFPTLKFFPKDSKTPVDYESGRTEADLVAFLNEKCGTHRAVGGGLNDKVSLGHCGSPNRDGRLIATFTMPGRPPCRI